MCNGLWEFLPNNIWHLSSTSTMNFTHHVLVATTLFHIDQMISLVLALGSIQHIFPLKLKSWRQNAMPFHWNGCRRWVLSLKHVFLPQSKVQLTNSSPIFRLSMCGSTCKVCLCSMQTSKLTFCISLKKTKFTLFQLYDDFNESKLIVRCLNKVPFGREFQLGLSLLHKGRTQMWLPSCLQLPQYVVSR